MIISNIKETYSKILFQFLIKIHLFQFTTNSYSQGINLKYITPKTISLNLVIIIITYFRKNYRN